ncbi:hypothetical protein JCM10908_002382 [Rhodotorula pacifica]|uniref:uncharacterized protein n=1 Tax=Rhodotorula pacifica TaxID=1495444 RepID=UPI003171C25C
MLAAQSPFRRPLLSLVRHASLAATDTAILAGQEYSRAGGDSTALPPHPVPPAKPTAAPAAISQYNGYFHARTRSIAHALAQGEHIPRNLLHKILANRKIPPDSLALWVDVLARRDPIYALERLGLLESAGVEMPGRRKSAVEEAADECPDWLYLALPGLITKASQVPYLASQILSERFARLDEQKRAVFVARCVQHFLRVRHYVALRELVEWVAYTPAEDPTALTTTRSFESILAALASERVRSDRYDATSPLILEPLVALVLATYTRRRGKSTLTFAMYRNLLSAKLVPRVPETALRLLARMTREGFNPSRAMLQQVMRVCARSGRHDAAVQLLEQIRGEASSGGSGAGAIGQWRERLDATIEEVHAAEEVPLHLRGWSSADLDRELEAYNEEDTASLPLKDADFPEHSLDNVRVRSAPSAAPESQSTSPPLSHDPTGQDTDSAPVQHAQDRFDTILLTDRAHVLPYFHSLLSYAHASSTTAAATFPSPPTYFDRVAWTQFFHTISLQSDVTADQLLAVLRAVARASTAASTSMAYVPPAPTLRLHTIVMNALVQRDEPRAALHMWRFLEKRGWQPDATLLDVVVRAHLALDHDRPAIRLLEHYAHRPELDPPETLVALPPSAGPDGTTSAQAYSVALSTVPLNALLAYYSRKNRFDAVYALYKDLEPRFAVQPDSATLSMMLDAARHASSRAGRGWTPTSAFEEVSAAGPVFGGSMAAHRTGLLTHPVDDSWDGEPASRIFERFVAHEVLEKNWQDARLEAPWESRGVVGWLARRFAGDDSSRRGAPPASVHAISAPEKPPPDWHPFSTTLSPTPPTQPHLYPTDRVFRSLIRLVGTHSSVTSIPPLISWMRHIHIRPSRFTLCVALAYVDGEASFRPEQMDRWRIWLADWLGEEALPTQAEIAWIRRGGKREGQPVTRRV